MKSIVGVVLSAFIFLGLAGSANAATKKMTVQQLEQMIAQESGKGDANLALNIYDVELTEQLTAARLQKDLATLPGNDSRTALTAVADISMFLAPPAEDIPADPTPDVATQRAIMQRFSGYVVQMIQSLPNFTAKRAIVHYHDYDSKEKINPLETPTYEAMHKAGVSNVSLTFRGGHEAIDRSAEKDKGNDPDTVAVNTESNYGAIILLVLKDMIHGSIKWSGWQTINGSKAAVFEYAVPAEQSHYKVNESTRDKTVAETPAYHGIFAVDAEKGTVLRLTVMTDLPADKPLTMSRLLVDYAPTTVGGKAYYLPAKSVYYFAAHLQYFGEIDWQSTTIRHENWYKSGPVQMRVYDMRFADYK